MAAKGAEETVIVGQILGPWGGARLGSDLLLD